jgi:drug/metabolite transporter (DMT)-like permease
MTARREPLFRGTLVALASATLFGVTTPVIAHFDGGVGPFTVAALLYAGAAVAALLLRLLWSRRGRPVTAASMPRILAVGLFGAALAPSLLAWGIGRAGPTAASLSLNLEASATVALAALFYREPIGGRVWLAMLAMLVGGTLVGVDVSSASSFDVFGVIAVAAAAVCWALDNTITRGLSEEDPLEVVAAKGGIGALMTTALALLRHENMPSPIQIAGLTACGATGYGVSLRLYLTAQRQVGAARTASVFAIAPFLGGAVSWAAGDRAAGPWTGVGALGFLIGIWLHLTERHGHRHRHTEIDHEHAHRHDDGHHDHVHDPPVVGEHTHRHHHSALEHDHPHAPDLHHVHDH